MRVPIVGTLLLVLIACNGSPSDPDPDPPNNNPPGNNPPPSGNTVVLNAGSFSPATITIDRTETVVWRNDSGIPHTITPVGHTQWTGLTTPSSGDVLTVTFNTNGTFNYECQLHGGMTGQVVVQ
jgi:hypothetical protein